MLTSREKCHLFGMMLLLCAESVWATTQARDLGGLATNLAGTFPVATRILIGGSYIAGIGFGLATAYKFKQYKDNPTQIPVGTPIALFIVSVMMVFAPGIISPAGQSLFGTTTEGVAYLNPTQGEAACGLPGSDNCGG